MAVEGTELELTIIFDGQVSDEASMTDIATEIANKVAGVEEITVKSKWSAIVVNLTRG